MDAVGKARADFPLMGDREGRVPVEELRATVDRMEGRLKASVDPDVGRLIRIYEELVPRFERDLADERDVLISRGAVLMLLQEIDGT